MNTGAIVAFTTLHKSEFAKLICWELHTHGFGVSSMGILAYGFSEVYTEQQWILHSSIKIAIVMNNFLLNKKQHRSHDFYKI